jgi:hypothetical protein
MHRRALAWLLVAGESWSLGVSLTLSLRVSLLLVELINPS